MFVIRFLFVHPWLINRLYTVLSRFASLYFMACSMNEYERVRFLARLLVDFPYGVVFNVYVMSYYINGYAEDLKLIWSVLLYT
jgi:hypothetical protein